MVQCMGARFDVELSLTTTRFLGYIGTGAVLGFGELSTQIPPHRLRRLPALRDCPHHQRLPPPRIPPPRKFLGLTCRVIERLDIPASVEFYSGLLQKPRPHGTGKAHRQQHQIRFEHNLVSGIELLQVKLFYVALAVSCEPRCRRRPVALASFFMRALDSQLQRPQRPWCR